MPKFSNLFKLILSIGLTLTVGFAGSLITTPNINGWYTSLNKPFFNPPSWVFGPVWTLLYILMGISLALVWQKKSKLTDKALSVFFVQLGLNYLWSFSFFYLKNPTLAFFNIILLLLTIIWTMDIFKKISLASFKLLIPYITWVSFATLLNLSIVWLNS